MREPKGFLMFSGGIEKEHRAAMGSSKPMKKAINKRYLVTTHLASKMGRVYHAFFSHS